MLNGDQTITVYNEKEDRMSLLLLTMMYTGFWTLIIDGNIINQAALTLIQASSLFLGIYYFVFALVKNMSPEINGVYIKKPMTIVGIFTIIVWLFFSMSIILSELFRNNSPHIGIIYLTYVPLIFFYTIPRMIYNPVETTVKATWYSGLIIVLLSLIWELPVAGSAYLGITNNSNSMGMVASQTALASLSLFYISFQKNKSNKKNILIYFITLVIAMLFLLASESRTSLLAVIVAVGIVFLHALFTKKIEFKHVFVLLLLLLLVYHFFLRNFFLTGVMEKIVTFSSSSNVLAGRSDIWGNIIKDSTLFGYGFEYFQYILEIQAHNNVLQFVGMYGTLAGLLLAIFLCFTVLLSIIYYIKNYNKLDAIIPFVFVVAYMILGMAETVLGFNAKTPTMVYFNFIGILLLYL